MFYNQHQQSKRIPREQVIQTKKTVSINDQYIEDEEKFIQTSVQKEIDASIMRVKEKEKILFGEIEKKKESLLQRMKEEVKEEAIREATERLKGQYVEKENELRQLIQEVNQEKIDFHQYLEENFQQIIIQNQKQIYNIATEMIHEIIAKEVQIDEGKLEEYLDNAILSLPKKTKIVGVRIHPKLLSYIRSKFENKYMGNIELFGDMDLDLHDIIIETEQEFVDVGMRTKLEQIKKWVEKLGVE